MEVPHSRFKILGPKVLDPKIFGSKIIFGQNILDLKNSRVLKNVLSRKIWGQKCVVQKFGVQNIIWCQNNFGHIFCVQWRFRINKKMCKKKFQPEKLLSKKMGSNTIWVQKFCSEKYFGSSHPWVTSDKTQTPYVHPLVDYSWYGWCIKVG